MTETTQNSLQNIQNQVEAKKNIHTFAADTEMLCHAVGAYFTKQMMQQVLHADEINILITTFDKISDVVNTIKNEFSKI